MGHSLEIKRYTLAEYLALEEAAEYKSEYYNGEIYAMSGSTPEHSGIIVDCIRALGNAFDHKGCDVYDSNVMIKIERLNVVLYPDASVFCEPLTHDPNSTSLVINLSLILEVLSKGTSKYDKGAKFFKYQMIPSLLTYVLIEQAEPRVYVANKNPLGTWAFEDYFGLDAVVDLKPHGISIAMRDIYRRIQF